MNEPMEMKDRIKKIRKDADLTQQKFADNIGIARGNIGSYEVGKNAPSDAVISLICKTFNVNEDWLRTGQGEPYIQKTRTDEITDFVNRIQTEDNPFKARLIQMLSKMGDDEWKLLEKMIDRIIKELEEPEETQFDSVEAAEAAYIKSRSGSASKMTRSVLNTTEEDTDDAAG